MLNTDYTKGKWLYLGLGMLYLTLGVPLISVPGCVALFS